MHMGQMAALSRGFFGAASLWLVMTAAHAKELPLRYENLTDNEVREIKTVAAGLKKGEIVSIGAATEGCRCEEDATTCSSQVRISLHAVNANSQVELSRINGHWDIGQLLRWELREEELRARLHDEAAGPNPVSYRVRLQEIDRLSKQRPICPVSPPSSIAGKTPAPRKE